ncbi:hypothetical protein F5Y16DRAFT_406663 [Xylariaceae sp. FL0255]|nr:hypothetical protein F5Y16DRAFT_406663 [Xylariaceae sp. FL0255]
MGKDAASSVPTSALGSPSATPPLPSTTHPAHNADSFQNVFPAHNLVKPSSIGRRRTGPLTEDQKARAALMRRLGACDDCKTRRISCSPEHHNMSWEQAWQRFWPPSPQRNPATRPNRSSRPIPTHFASLTSSISQAMHIYPMPSFSTAPDRKPLPTQPRPIKQLPLPPFATGLPLSSPSYSGCVKVDVENPPTSGVSSSTSRNRYTNVSVLFIQ